MRVAWILLAVWLIIGALAGEQRHYYRPSSLTCAGAGTIAATLLAGPTNYFGAYPRLTCH
jgi:hypothetical protein